MVRDGFVGFLSAEFIPLCSLLGVRCEQVLWKAGPLCFISPAGSILLQPPDLRPVGSLFQGQVPSSVQGKSLRFPFYQWTELKFFWSNRNTCLPLWGSRPSLCPEHVQAASSPQLLRGGREVEFLVFIVNADASPDFSVTYFVLQSS